MRILVAGASGFIGRALVGRLVEDGHDVVAASRSGRAAQPGSTALPLDIADEEAAAGALEGVGAAYYLVHSMDAGESFAERDLALAESFSRAAASAGVGRIVYLGGLGSGELSDHLRSRQEVGAALASTGVDVVELRAAVILGAGSISFEMMRYLVERLPAMVCPRWVKTPIEPILVDEVIAYLTESLTVPPGIYEVGGTATTYEDLMQTYARVRGLPKRLILDVPLLTLHLSSYWVDFVTPVDRRVSHSLIKSLAIPVIVSDRARTDAAFTVRPRPLDDSIRRCLDDQYDAIGAELTTRAPGLADGVWTVRNHRPVTREQASAIAADLAKGGGSLTWYGIPAAWWLRLKLGRLLGELASLRPATEIQSGGQFDWWEVLHWDGSLLVLRSDSWTPGEAWLAYQVEQDPEPSFTLHAAFRSKGILGFLYWRLLDPIHRWAFGRMTEHRIQRVS